MQHPNAICLPVRAFNDRRIKGTHLRVLAAIAMLGEGPLSHRQIIAECGVSDRDLRRDLRELYDFSYITIELIEGFVSLYKIEFGPVEGGEIFPPGECIPAGEETSPEGEEQPAHQANGVSPPDGPPFPPTPPIPPLKPPTSPAKSGRASRLPTDWQPSPSNCGYAEQHGFSGDGLSRQIEDFRDYWHARAGPAGLKLDWSKTWAMWIRKAKDWKASKNGKVSPHDAEIAAFDYITR